ncbi:MAG: cadherin domain-containing protein [Planctomycetales bacterium]|nr:cadherin domain-containing protein [Planctomycetales bacterium]
MSNSAGEYPLNGEVARLEVSNEFWSAAQVLAQAESFAALNSPPTFALNIISDVVAEDIALPVGSTLAEITIVDDNLLSDEISVVTLSGADAGQFQVVDVNGTLKLQWAGSTTLDFETQSSYSVIIIIDEAGVGAEPDAVQTFVLTVTDVNEPPSVSFNPASGSIDENTDTSAAVFIADIVVDDDALGTNTISLSGTDAGSFSIGGTPQSGYQILLNAGVTLEATTKPTYDVSVSVDDSTIGSGPESTANFTLTVFGNAAPTIALTQVLTEIHEDALFTPQIKVADIVITDDLAGDNVLSLSGDDAGLFEILGSIPSAGLYLRTDAVLDYETNATLNATVTVNDGFNTPASDSLSVAVNDANDPPVVSGPVTLVSIDEDTTPVTIMAAQLLANATDPNSGTTLSVLNLTADSGQLIEVVAGAEWTFTPTANFNGLVTFSYLVSDSALSTPASATLDVLPVNDPPTISNQSFTISENLPNGLFFGQLIASDIDANEILTFSAIGGSGASAFSVSSTGAITVSNSSLLDYEGLAGTTPPHSLALTVQVTDGASATATATVTVTLVNANDRPDISASFVLPDMSEDAGPITITETQLLTHASDQDVPSQTLGVINVLVTSGTIAPGTNAGEWLYTPPQDFNGTVTFSYRVTDGVASSPTSAQLTVLPVNDNPVIASQAWTINENAANGSFIGTATASDVDTGDTLTFEIVSGSGQGDAFDIDPTTGEITVLDNGVLDFETTPTLTFDVKVSDQATGSAVATMTIELVDVNEPPAVSLINAISELPENTDTSSSIKLADIVVSDDALGTATLTLTGGDATSFDMVAGTNGPELYLKANESLDFETQVAYTVTVEVDDPTLGTSPDASAVYVLTITDVNEPPVVALTPVVASLPEDAVTSSRIKVADITITDDALGTNEWSLSGTDAALFEIDATELFLVAGTSLDYETNPLLDVTVTVDDSETTPSSDAMTIAITDVNEPPTAVTFVDEVTSINENTDTTTSIKVADIVVADDALGTNTLSIVGTEASHFEIVPGTLGPEVHLKANEVLDYETQSTYDVTIEVNDPSVGTTPDVTANYTLSIVDMNESPAIELIQTVTSLREDAITSPSIKVADISVVDDVLGINVLSIRGDDASLFEIVDNSLYLVDNAALDFETNSQLSVTVVVDDGETPADAQSLNINIEDVDEVGPVILAVRAGGSQWAPEFNVAADPRLELGYLIPTGQDQIKVLPWGNIDTIYITFNEQIAGIEANDVTITGVNVESYELLDVSFDASINTARVRLANSFGVDRIRIHVRDTITDIVGNPIDGEWTDYVSSLSGDGTNGGDFDYRFNVLVGDVNQSNRVLANDTSIVRSKQLAVPSSPNYSVFADVNGSGRILANDTSIVRQHQLSSLPDGEP